MVVVVVVVVIVFVPSGWTLPNTSITLGMKDRYTYVPLLELVNNLTNLYVPELGLGYSPSCCSDHQSFFEQGYPAVGCAFMHRCQAVVRPLKSLLSSPVQVLRERGQCFRLSSLSQVH